MKRAFLLLALVAGCAASGPVALRWGEEGCRHCHMTLADRRFGAELVSATGRPYAFDDAGCAALFLASGDLVEHDVGSAWVIDFLHPDSLIPAGSARFVRSAAFRTPMGSGVIAVADPAAADSLARATQGERLSWRELVDLAHAGRLGHG